MDEFYKRNPVVAEFAGRLIQLRPQEQLLRNAFNQLKHMRRWRGMPLWTLVGAITSHGSGYSQQVCKELGWDYEMKVGPNTELPRRPPGEGGKHE